MKTEIDLSPKQEEAVLHQEGALLVKASAGSGKTRVLTERIKRLLDSTKKKILAITFTNKAGEEMLERLGDSEKVKSQVFVGTFHSFCQQILEMRGHLLGYSTMPQIFEKESDRLVLIEQAIEMIPEYLNEYRSRDEKKQREMLYQTLEFIAKVKRNLWSDEELLKKSEGNDNVVLLYHNYEDILVSQNAIDYDDLIMLTHRLFVNNPKIASFYRKTYQYICIDEAQDLNNAQYELIKALTGDVYNNIIMVGDSNQSIYAFNGSSAEYMNERFINEYGAKVIDLTENYRCSKRVIEASESIIPGANEFGISAKEGVFEINVCNDEDDEADWVISAINELIEIKKHDDIEGEITYEKMAVLGRTKYVFSNLERKLEEASIPYYYKITPGAIKFSSNTMNIWDLALRIKLYPSDRLHLIRLIKLLKIKNDSASSITQQIGAKGNDILKTLFSQTNIEHYKKAIEFIINLKDDGSNIKTLSKSFKEFVNNTTSIESDDDKSMIDNEIGDILNHWSQYARKTDKKSISQFKNAMALGKTHPNSVAKGITLSTVHTMKGQEYDIVFIIGMDEGTFPHYKAVQNEGIEMSQEKNNAYVAFTRAKRFLFVTYPEKRLMPWGDYKHRRPSRFLENLL
jgi:DNA helicase-2/ATP-dependent DNA helicase PcrA